ncbi:MAG TPA: glyoxylate/hydroxypyruvate reductase A, partial [Spirochaeta sp.]|nr:glyoxylate/hydroxypyruvate reductase A [Spirochaeta sp.]
MSLVIISKKSNQGIWEKALKSLDPELDVSIYPDDINREEVDFALVWHPPLGVFNEYPNLKCIASTGAGVDHILKDPDLPKDVVLTRVVDPLLTQDMTSYLLAQVMCHTRNVSHYKLLQTKNEWQPKRYHDKTKITIGIMGYGELGRDAGEKFKSLGFNVIGWANSAKNIDGIKIFVGDDEFSGFLNKSDILICLLPLTPATLNILNRKTFSQLPKGAFIINVARGEHLVVDDLIEAIDTGQLSGACLDVFRQEPLPKEHLFWRHPRVTVTPHIASITSPESVAPQIIENYRRLER